MPYQLNYIPISCNETRDGKYEYQWVTVAVAMAGKLGASAGFILVYIYSSELLPTIVRSAGMGTSSAFARVGSILASYVQQWSLEMGGDFGKALPLLVFGAFSLVAGLLTLVLPETLHKDLPDTIEDGLKFGRDPDSDEHQDLEKVVEVFTIGDIQIEMETLQTTDVLVHAVDTKERNGLIASVHANDHEDHEDAKDVPEDGKGSHEHTKEVREDAKVHDDAKEVQEDVRESHDTASEDCDDVKKNHRTAKWDHDHLSGDHDDTKEDHLDSKIGHEADEKSDGDAQEQTGMTSPGIRDPDPTQNTKKVNFADPSLTTFIPSE